MPKICFNAQAPKAPARHEKVGMSLDDITKRERERKGGPQGGQVQRAGRSAKQAGWAQPQAGRGQQHAGRGRQPAGRGQPYIARSQPQQHASQQQAKTSAHPAYEKLHNVQKSQPGPKQHQFLHQQGPPAHTKVGGVVYKPVPTLAPAAQGGGRGKPGVPGSGRGRGAAANDGEGGTGQTDRRGYHHHQQHQQQMQLYPRIAFKPQHNRRRRRQGGGTLSKQDLAAAAKNPQHPLHHMLTKIVEAKLSQHTSGNSRERGAVTGEDVDLEALLGEEVEDKEVEGEGEEEEEGEGEVEGSAGPGSKGGLHSALGSSCNGALGGGEDEDTKENAEMPGALLDAGPSRPQLRPAPGKFITSINAKRREQGGLPPPPLPSSGVRLPSRLQHNHHHHLHDLPPYPPGLSGGGGALELHSSRQHRGVDWDNMDGAERAAYSHGMRLERMSDYRSRHDYYDDLVIYNRVAGSNSRRPLPDSGNADEDDYGQMRISRGSPRILLSPPPQGRAPYSIGRDSYEPGMPLRRSRSRSRSPLRSVRNGSVHGYVAEVPLCKGKGSSLELQQQRQQHYEAQEGSRLQEREREREHDETMHGQRMRGGRGGSREGRSPGAPALRGVAASSEPAAAAAAAEGPDTGMGRGTLASFRLTETLFPDPGSPQCKVSSMHVARAAIAIEYIKSQETRKRAVLPLWQLQRLKKNIESGQLPVVVPKPQGQLELTVLDKELVNVMCDKDPSMDIIRRGIDLINTSEEWAFASQIVKQQLDNDEDMSQIWLDYPGFAALPEESKVALMDKWYNDEWPTE